MDASTDYLSDLDWNFDKVPDEELAACCLWEYARESDSLRFASQIEWCHTRDITFRDVYPKDPQLKAEHDTIAASIKRMVALTKFDYEAFGNTFWDHELALVDIYQSLKSYIHDGSRPWQRLGAKVRANLATQVTRGICLRPLANATVGELEELWTANRGDVDEVRAEVVPVYDDSEEAALWAESTPIKLKEGTAMSSGSTAVAFAVDFTRFTDNEICENFVGWLKANRPKEWATPKRIFPNSKRRGRKLVEFRVGLERLGLMRLLHYYSPDEMRRELPNAWTKYKKKKNDFRREVREASKVFRKLFPFLPREERASSEIRKGVWLPEMMALWDKVEQEMARRGIK